MTPQELCALAQQALKNAYAPYSGCKVGAALLTKNGRVFTGCNVENAAFGPTVCAERVALFKAVSEGCLEFTALAVAGGKGGVQAGAYPPCGVCRQVLAEFCVPSFKIYLSAGSKEPLCYTLGELLPTAFSKNNLG